MNKNLLVAIIFSLLNAWQKAMAQPQGALVNPANPQATIIPPTPNTMKMTEYVTQRTSSEPDTYYFNAVGKSFSVLILSDGTVNTIHGNLKFNTNPNVVVLI